MNFNFIYKRLSSISDLLLSNILANITLLLGVYTITKIVTPNEFGKYALFISAVLMGQPIFTLRYEQAVSAAVTGRIANVLFLFCVIFNVSIAVTGFVVTYVVVACMSPQFDTDIAEMALLIWPACFSFALYSTAQAMILRAGELRKLAISRIIKVIVCIILQIFLILYVSSSVNSLIVGEVVSNIIVSIIMIYWSRSHFGRYLFYLRAYKYINVARRNMTAAVKRFRVFAFVGLPHAFLHSLAAVMFSAAIGAFYGTAALGQYSLMRRMIFGVTALFSVAAYQLGVSEASAAKGNWARLAELYKSVITIVGFISIPSAAFMLIWGRAIFSIVFGEAWSMAGDLAAAAFLLIAVEPIASAIAFIPLFLKRQPAAFVWSIVQNVAGLASFALVFTAGGGISTAILGSSLVVGAVLITYLVWLFRLCSRHTHASRKAVSA